MIVVAIIGVLAALGIAALYSARERGAAENAANDLSSHLSAARARAIERGVPVWVIVYPGIDLEGAEGGAGAYFVYEDTGMGFGTSGVAAVGQRRYDTFTPPDDIYPEPLDQGRLLERVYLDRYTGKNVAFGQPAGLNFAAPFAGLEASFGGDVACNFCSGTPSRGAIVFGPEGAVRFLDGDGDRVLDGIDRLDRTGALRVMGRLTNQGYLYAVSGPTGFVGFFK
jgi:type II secretory pathway pseudopilin PulG